MKTFEKIFVSAMCIMLIASSIFLLTLTFINYQEHKLFMQSQEVSDVSP